MLYLYLPMEMGADDSCLHFGEEEYLSEYKTDTLRWRFSDDVLPGRDRTEEKEHSLENSSLAIGSENRTSDD